MLLVFTRAGASQDEPRSKPSFAVAVSAAHVEFEPGAPIPVKLTMTNTSDRDLTFSVTGVQCPPLINEWVTMRQVQVLLYDSEGNLVPLTRYGAAVQGRTGPVAKAPGADREQGVGCGGRSTIEILRPGESRIEETDLSKEFDIKKAGTYTVRAQRLDKESQGLVKSEAVTVTLVAIE